jgi:hypothetical protein
VPAATAAAYDGQLLLLPLLPAVRGLADPLPLPLLLLLSEVLPAAHPAEDELGLLLLPDAAAAGAAVRWDWGDAGVGSSMRVNSCMADM